MSTASDTSVLIDHRFGDFDELAAAARHWHLDLIQLDRGQFDGEVFQAVVGGVLLSEARFGRALVQMGAAPQAMRTFAVPATPNVRFKWRRHDVGPSDLLVFPPSGELHAVSHPDFHVFTISLPEELLHEAAQLLDVTKLEETLRRERLHGSLTLMNRLRASLYRVIHAAKQETRSSSRSAALAKWQREIPMLLVKAMATASGSATVHAVRKRDQAVKRAEAYVAQHQDQPLTVADLCRVVKVSERTLQYGFLEHLGVTPKAYLKAVRMNGVHRELKSADPRHVRINEVASRWGFWHMGQFAADYRRQFGALPSQTVSSAFVRSG